MVISKANEQITNHQQIISVKESFQLDTLQKLIDDIDAATERAPNEQVDEERKDNNNQKPLMHSKWGVPHTKAHKNLWCCICLDTKVHGGDVPGQIDIEGNASYPLYGKEWPHKGKVRVWPNADFKFTNQR